MKLLPSLVTALILTTAAVGAAPGHQIVVLVWDGLRPDFVTPATTPQLSRLASDGVFFAHHHSVYLSSTEVNGTALATGSHPAHSGIVANTDYRPGIDPQKPVETQSPDAIRLGDQLTQGHYLGRPTVAELLHTHGLATAVAGSKQVALLHDRAERTAGPGVSPLLAEGETLPASLAAALTRTHGNFPAASARDDKTARDAWTTRALLHSLWADGVPPYSLLWLAEPDSSQHATGPGSPQSLEAIKACDDRLGEVLAELDHRGLRATTDVLVVSDHGFSTIARKVDVATELSVAGFDAKRAVLGQLHPGEVLVVGNGGSSLFYVGHHDATVLARLTAWLQTQDWAGVIFSRTPAEGTFALNEAHLDSPQAPDLVVSYRWTEGKNTHGTPGLQISDLSAASQRVGNHASLSPYDLHNTLVASGPDFRRGVTSTLPSANTDVAPTILWLLGLPDEARKMDGRVLSEALTVPAPALQSYELQRLQVRRETATEVWTQYLQLSSVNGVRYLDAGNGELK